MTLARIDFGLSVVVSLDFFNFCSLREQYSTGYFLDARLAGGARSNSVNSDTRGVGEALDLWSWKLR